MMTRLALLSRLYFFDQVRVGTDAVYRDLWKFEADHSAPLSRFLTVPPAF